MPKIIDLTGNKYGLLTVVKKSDKRCNGKILWECQCECGQICLKTKESLERPSQKPKACSPQCQNQIKIGDKFNRLTVIEIMLQEKKATKYKCQCDCGNIVITESSKLKAERIKSCGCYRQERMSELGLQNSQALDLTNQHFGKLIALEPTEKRQNKSIIWKCICDCGQIHYASANNLKSGNVTRCSNCSISSKGEEKIKQLLEELEISFVKEKTFDTCRFPKTNALAKFDFYVNNKYLIEYDGKQHYEKNNPFNISLSDIQDRDNFKNKWCKDNEIPLIRIPYTHLLYLKKEDLVLETSKFLIR